MIHAAVAKVVAGAVLAGGAVAGVGATTHCNPGEVLIGGSCGKVTGTMPDETRGTGVTSAVTVDVDFRDTNGNRTNSGISTQDQFEWLGGKKQGKGGDGTLIEVKQITHGKGGWGPAYKGWIPVKFTQIPGMFKSAPTVTPEPTRTPLVEPTPTPTVETEQGG